MSSQTLLHNSNGNNIALLARLELERRKRNRPLPTFRNAPAQIQTTTDPEWLLAGPAGTGKTFAGLYRLHMLCATNPNAHCIIIRQVAKDLASTTLMTWQKVINFGHMQPKEIGGTNPRMWIYPNGAIVRIGGMDNSSKVLGGEFDMAYISQAEELSKDAWETLITRTNGRGAVVEHPMLGGDCNPATPNHWILERAKAGRLKLYETRHEDNPVLHDGTNWTEQGRKELESLDSLTGTRYARLRLGLWVDDDEGESFLGSITLWDNCSTTLPPLTSHQPIVLGMDAAINGDAFALVGVSLFGASSDQTLAVRLCRIWEPNGTPLDYGQIESEIRNILNDYNVVQIAYDPYQAHYLAQRLSDKVWCEPFNQQSRRLEADAALRQLIISRRLFHNGDHDVLRQHIMNANAKVDETGHKLRIVKRDSSKKIDAVVALSMACHASLGLNLY